MNGQHLLPTHYLLFAILLAAALHFFFPGGNLFPPRAGLREGEHLLVVRASGWALGFLQRGPIYEEALRRPEIEVFSA